jgi:hypothetical protein
MALNYSNHDISTSGLITASSGNFISSLQVNSTGVSLIGHTHTASDISNFNSSVSGLLPVGTANYLSKFGTAGSGLSNSLIFDDGTNVGIGTATPYSKLQVNGSLSVAIDGSDVSTGGEGIIFGTDGSIYSNDSGPGPMLSLDQTNGLRIYGDGGTSSAVILSTDRGYARIGIGTATPDSTLHVVGDVNIDGNLTFDSFTESVVAIGNSSTSKTISLTSGTVQTCTLTGNCTFTMPTATAGKSFSLFLNTGSGGFTATFTGVRWSDSTPPTITSTASKVDLLSFISDGSYWYGSFSQNYG